MGRTLHQFIKSIKARAMNMISENNVLITERKRIKKEIEVYGSVINDDEQLNENINALEMACTYMLEAAKEDYQRYHFNLSSMIGFFRAKRELMLLDKNF